MPRTVDLSDIRRQYPHVPLDVGKIETVLLSADLVNGKLAAEGMRIEGACRSYAHCAVGELLFQAGMTNEELRSIPAAPEEWDWDDKAPRLLHKHYGLRRLHADRITLANDDGGSNVPVAVRRERVMRMVRDLAARPDFAACDEWDEGEDDEPYDDD